VNVGVLSVLVAGRYEEVLQKAAAVSGRRAQLERSAVLRIKVQEVKVVRLLQFFVSTLVSSASVEDTKLGVVRAPSVTRDLTSA
jgi:hypothetical protein